MAEAVPPPSVARFAGALYLGTIMFDLFAEVGSRGTLIVGSDAAATGRAILANEGYSGPASPPISRCSPAMSA